LQGETWRMKLQSVCGMDFSSGRQSMNEGKKDKIVMLM